LEDSILSAIADAVDVLADDGTVPQQGRRQPPPERSAEVQAEPDNNAPYEAEYEEDLVEDEIGDEIQRILSSYGDRR
jgi:hypothetical protein